MKSSTSSLSLLLLASSTLALSAQTAAHPATTTHTTAAHPATHAVATGGCMVLPPISPKIPALPASTGCPKVLYSVTKHADITLDYKAPIIAGDHLETAFGIKSITLTLGYADAKVGTGELAKEGMYLTVKYTGYLTDGTKFDASSDHGTDGFPFQYGAHHVIAGWDTGFEGMRVGGKRRLFIPYLLAYGEAGKPPTIPAKSMLVFDMELVSVSAAPPAPPAPPTPPAAPKPAPAPSPAGSSAPPPTTSTTPAASTAPNPPASSSQSKQ